MFLEFAIAIRWPYIYDVRTEGTRTGGYYEGDELREVVVWSKSKCGHGGRGGHNRLITSPGPTGNFYQRVYFNQIQSIF